MNKKDKDVATAMYPAQGVSNSEVEEGLSITHEQVTDVYAEGTIDATIENYQGTGQAKRIPREGYNEKDPT